uniref:Uncharacterized protein n=1 Tax=Rhizophora mucronata TaxID=61149 RepID=A0A2P2PDC1_RHIMU
MLSFPTCNEPDIVGF